MKTLASAFLAVWLFAAAAPAAPSAELSFKGEIMDSQCAQVGSHDKMTKAEGAKTAKECSDTCVKMGGRYVLYDEATKTTYQLDDQKRAAEFSGQKVIVTGSMVGNTIHISTIGAES